MRKTLLSGMIVAATAGIGCLSGGGDGPGVRPSAVEAAAFRLNTGMQFVGGSVIASPIAPPSAPATILPVGGQVILSPGSQDIVPVYVEGTEGDQVVATLVQFGTSRKHVSVTAQRRSPRSQARQGEGAPAEDGNGFEDPGAGDAPGAGSGTGGVPDTFNGGGGGGGTPAFDPFAPAEEHHTEVDPGTDLEMTFTIDPLICHTLCDGVLNIPVTLAAKLATGRVGSHFETSIELDCTGYGRSDRCTGGGQVGTGDTRGGAGGEPEMGGATDMGGAVGMGGSAPAAGGGGGSAGTGGSDSAGTGGAGAGATPMVDAGAGF